MNDIIEFVNGLVEQEKWKAYENIKAKLKGMDLSEEEYMAALKQAVEELKI